MKRYGTVLVFKAGITSKEATEAINKIADVLDLPKEAWDWETTRKRPYELIDGIHEFDDEIGGPVWYIP